MDALARANAKNPAVKRLLQEYKELSTEQCRDFVCEPLEDNIFEWHFVVRGPRDTDFEGGLFHGRIVLPPEYPFKPPTFAFLTPNGRFEVNTKICLSISTHHPEHWQPSWSLRTALTALAAFFPTKGDGAIGALDYPPQERRALAAASRGAPPLSGQSETRAAVTRALHERMLAAEALPLSPPPASCEGAAAAEAPPTAAAQAGEPEPSPPPAAEAQVPSSPPAASERAASAAAESATAALQPQHTPCADGCGARCAAALEAAARDIAAGAPVAAASPPPAAAPTTPAAASPLPRPAPPPRSPQPQPAAAQRSQAELEAEERRLVRAAFALAAAIVAILIRRAMLWATAVAA